MLSRTITLTLSSLALAAASFAANAADHVFSNTAPITAPAEGGQASPYPTIIPVSGLSGDITEVTVTIDGFSSGDLYSALILLVTPGGQNIALLNGQANGTASTSNATWTFSAAGIPVPSGIVPSGIYLPSNFFSADSAPAPAPAGPYSTDLTTINGAAAGQNGDWQLYVMNFSGAANQSALSIANGWTLNISDAPSISCASEGYTGTKLNWCKIICESESSAYTIDTYLRRWINRYHDLPYCALEEEEAPVPTVQSVAPTFAPSSGANSRSSSAN